MTMTLISTTTITVNTTTITLSNIPQTGNDLYVVISPRYNYATTFTGLYMRINGNSSSIYNKKIILGSGSAASSSSATLADAFYFNIGAVGTTGTANTFANGSIYFPNYSTTDQNKSFSIDHVVENNTSEAYLELFAGSFDSTSAITSLSFYQGSVSPVIPFISGTSISIYSITKGSGGASVA